MNDLFDSCWLNWSGNFELEEQASYPFRPELAAPAITASYTVDDNGDNIVDFVSQIPNNSNYTLTGSELKKMILASYTGNFDRISMTYNSIVQNRNSTIANRMEFDMGKNDFIQMVLREYTLQGDNQAIMRLIVYHEPMPEFLLEAAKVIRKRFGSEATISLSVEEIEGSGEPFLFARVLTDLPVMEALAIVDQIDNDWLLDNLDRVQGRFNFDVEWK